MASNGKGGFFIVPSGYDFPVTERIFTPEDFSDDQRMIAETAERFAGEFTEETIRGIDSKKDSFRIMLDFFKKAGELGLSGIDVPEEYGGVGFDFVTAMLVSEKLGIVGSWAVSWAVNVGVGTHPLLFFGTDEQKKRYLPKLTSGEWIAAFAATEPDAGSDLFSMKTNAVLDGDNYVLNGNKAFVTNAGFANLLTVVARVDKDENKTACFLVERSSPGVSVGREEGKMGITGSSTCPVAFENVRVPKENLLGPVGRGFHIMLNALNLGRLKLTLMTVGSAKHIISAALQYGLERKQFGKPIVYFGLNQEKLAEMMIRTWMVESAAYRTSALVGMRLENSDLSNLDEAMNALREHTIECALLKVAGSELLWDVADHCLQIMGGYGYSTEYPAERWLRDARINRIFEGTSEINRLVAISTLLEKAGKNELPLMQVISRVVADIDEMSFDEPDTSFPAMQGKLVDNMKKMFLFAAGLVYQKFGHDKNALMNRQEILGRLSDMLMNVYLAESGLLRAKQIGGEIPEAIVAVFVQSASWANEIAAKEILASMQGGDMLKSYLGRLKRLSKMDLVDAIGLRRKIAAKLIKEEEYYL